MSQCKHGSLCKNISCRCECHAREQNMTDPTREREDSLSQLKRIASKMRHETHSVDLTPNDDRCSHYAEVCRDDCSRCLLEKFVYQEEKDAKGNSHE